MAVLAGNMGGDDENLVTIQAGLLYESRAFTAASSTRNPVAEFAGIFSDEGTVMPVWLIRRVDSGYIYIVEHHGQYKIGKTTRTKQRMLAAQIRLPNMHLIGFKPFWGMSHHERRLHTGFVRSWYLASGIDLTAMTTLAIILEPDSKLYEG
ncbi:hypothetical protein ACETRX_34420 [Labrys portucalensis]|uniref:GIY-YIG nuclease family protein n=1 Tax=Labrys neptuniae TaxID=376174 RepID=A0ABV6ZRK9_9HYPH